MGAGVSGVHEINRHSWDHEVMVLTNSSEVARKVSTVAKSDTLQEAVKSGSRLAPSTMPSMRRGPRRGRSRRWSWLDEGNGRATRKFPHLWYPATAASPSLAKRKWGRTDAMASLSAGMSAVQGLAERPCLPESDTDWVCKEWLVPTALRTCFCKMICGFLDSVTYYLRRGGEVQIFTRVRQHYFWARSTWDVPALRMCMSV